MNIRRHSRGFSLIEILVVVVIIAIVTSIAILSVGLLGEDDEMQTEARRLVSLIEVAQDEAMMQGREFGLEFMTDSYRFVEFDPLINQWGELFADEMFRTRELPEDVEFALSLEGQRIILELDPAKLEDPDEDKPDRNTLETYSPHVLIFSSGDITPFELVMTRLHSDQRILLEGDLTGEVEIVTDED